MDETYLGGNLSNENLEKQTNNSVQGVLWEITWVFAKAEWKVSREKLSSAMVQRSVSPVQFVPSNTESQRRGGAEGVDWEWFGVSNFWQQADLFKQKQIFPQARWTWLSVPMPSPSVLLVLKVSVHWKLCFCEQNKLRMSLFLFMQVSCGVSHVWPWRPLQEQQQGTFMSQHHFKPVTNPFSVDAGGCPACQKLAVLAWGCTLQFQGIQKPCGGLWSHWRGKWFIVINEWELSKSLSWLVAL